MNMKFVRYRHDSSRTMIFWWQSDCIFNSRWIEDAGKVIDHLHTQYPQAPLFVVGTSVGANALVCYLFIGYSVSFPKLTKNLQSYLKSVIWILTIHLIPFEPVSFFLMNDFQVIYLCGEGVNPAIVGAAAICNPWDILVSLETYTYNLY